MDKLIINLTLCLTVFLTVSDVSDAYKNYYELCTIHSDCTGQLYCFPDPKNSGIKRCLCNYGYIYSTNYKDCRSMNTYTCNYDTQCQDRDLNRKCVNNKCKCVSGTQEDPNTYRCIMPPKGRFSKCQTDENCQDSLICYQRTSTCLCKVGYSWVRSENRCHSINYAICANDTDCQDRDKNRICDEVTDKCFCKQGFETDESSQFCVKEKPKHNETCDEVKGCRGDLECVKVGRKNICLCSTGYFWKKGECVWMNSYKCNSDEECQDQDKNRFCDRETTGKCSCPKRWRANDWHWCVKQKNYNQLCQNGSVNECQDGLICRYHNNKYTCRCPDDQFWIAAQNRCLSWGEFRCNTSKECQELDSLRICNSTSRCGCKIGYYEDNSTCRQQKQLGELCKGPNECAAPDSMCFKANCFSLTGVCACQPTHRRSGENCFLRSCKNDTECQSPLFDEDTNLICQEKKCGCKKGYSMDLIEGRCTRRRDQNVVPTTVTPANRTTTKN